MENKIWLILEKSDETRVSSSIESYRDKTGEEYNYDSLVPNYKNIGNGDYIIIRKEDDILGVGIIKNITSNPAIKIHKRCPNCSTTDIRLRKGKSPQWKCGKCKSEFHIPNETSANVINFKAKIIDFSKFDIPPTVSQIKSCAFKGDGQKSQNSIMQLDPTKVSYLLSIDFENSETKDVKQSKGQGIGLSFEERKAVELHAMKIVHDQYFKNGWMLVDTSNAQPYDFVATKGDVECYIEVKGTTGDGLSIILTHGEVKHVKNNPNKCVLIVISNIKIEKKANSITANGGDFKIHADPWIIDDNNLSPTQYRYLTTSPNKK